MTGKLWQVICIQRENQHKVYETTDCSEAEAKAGRLNKLTRGTVKYVVEEVTDESKAANC